MHLEHAVLELRSHLLPISVLREGEAARKAPVRTLDSVILPVLFLLLKHPLSRNREHIVLNCHLHILLLDLGKLGLDEIFFVILYDVHQRRPLGHSHRFVLGAIFTDRRTTEQGGEPGLQLVQFLEWIPTCNGVHAVLLFSICLYSIDPTAGFASTSRSAKFHNVTARIVKRTNVNRGETSGEAGFLTDAKPVLGETKIRTRRAPGRPSGPGPSACSKSRSRRWSAGRTWRRGAGQPGHARPWKDPSVRRPSAWPGTPSRRPVSCRATRSPAG